MKIKLTILASGQVKWFGTMSECESWYMVRFGNSSVRVEEICK